MLKDEATGSFEKTISDSLGNNTILPEDTVHIQHTANLQLTHQGKHLIRSIEAALMNDTLLLFTMAELPAYTGTIAITVNKGKAFFMFHDVPFEPLYNEHSLYIPLRQSLLLNKKHYRVGDTLRGRLEYRFREDHYKSGTKVSAKIYSVSGNFETVIRRQADTD